MVKDYYKILDIEPSATRAEIKIAYRKLVHQYHPDKNPGDLYALAQFNLVKEAYETLSQPTLKTAYLKERWLTKANVQSFEYEATTPEYLLKRLLKVSTNVQNMDMFRADKNGIANTLFSLFTKENIDVLNEFKEASINEEIITQALRVIPVLKPKAQYLFLNKLKDIQHPPAQKTIAQKEKEIKQAIIFASLKPWLIGLAALLFCLLIFFSSR